ncbi:hemoglobin [Solimonas aquatica]|uniref:Hemoglobin n=1 Tax=Solimonas aquatica TaxID=489703 RepID=A0A1H9L5L8_9GAMM|nr:group II truncated hemoglobin [Solimonas aquatica]SER06791.1 hemoglobin [Solimonas aquatica]
MSEAAAKVQPAPPTPYEMLGGEAAVRALADAFYDAMDALPQAATIRAMHGESLAEIKEKLFEYLSGWLGGPRLYYQKYGSVCLGHAHAPYAIGRAERDQWLACMEAALQAVDASEEVRQILRHPMYRMANALRTRDD